MRLYEPVYVFECVPQITCGCVCGTVWTSMDKVEIVFFFFFQLVYVDSTFEQKREAERQRRDGQERCVCA